MITAEIGKGRLPSLILYQLLCTAFSLLVVISNIISVKMVKLPYLQDFSIPAGLIFYPLTFLLSNIVTEFFGSKRARLMVYIAMTMNLISLCMIQFSLILPSPSESEHAAALKAVLGLSGWRIFSSLLACMTAQIIDIQLYSLIKRWTGTRFLWIRNNGSTLISQLVDTMIVDLVYLYWGLEMPLPQVFAIMSISYIYKMFFTIANTPLFYLLVFLTKWPDITSMIRTRYVPSILATTQRK